MEKIIEHQKQIILAQQRELDRLRPRKQPVKVEFVEVKMTPDDYFEGLVCKADIITLAKLRSEDEKIYSLSLWEFAEKLYWAHIRYDHHLDRQRGCMSHSENANFNKIGAQQDYFIRLAKLDWSAN